MSSDSIQILCTGDIHLGRRPTRIPDRLDTQAHSPRAVWQSIAEAAVTRDVDAVLVSGDALDQENQYYEAYGAFEDGAALLDDADIPTYLVTGNHDANELPHLISNLDLDNVTLLGTDGEWERQTLSTGSGTVHIDGWSYPQEYVRSSPLDTYEMDTQDEPTIGVLHGDLDSENSDYAPINTNTLATSGPDIWVLGHIHAPDIRSQSDPLVMYPGSPQPLNPGEPDTHGPWLLTIENGSVVDCSQEPHASIRYGTVDIDASGLTDKKDIRARIQDEIEEHIREKVPTQSLDVFLPRVRLTGRTELHSELVTEASRLAEQVQFKVGDIDVRIDTVTSATKPDIDLEAHAGDASPVGYLADLLLDLDDGATEEHARLIESAKDAVDTAQASNAYTPLQKEGRLAEATPDSTVDVLEQQARLLLDELIAQKEEDPR